MKTSQDRILTTHVGSLPRPQALRQQLVRKDQGEAYDKAERYCRSVRQWSVSPGNFAGGLTTIEEKSLGAFAKSGTRSIQVGLSRTTSGTATAMPISARMVHLLRPGIRPRLANA